DLGYLQQIRLRGVEVAVDELAFAEREENPRFGRLVTDLTPEHKHFAEQGVCLRAAVFGPVQEDPELGRHDRAQWRVVGLHHNSTRGARAGDSSEHGAEVARGHCEKAEGTRETARVAGPLGDLDRLAQQL